MYKKYRDKHHRVSEIHLLSGNEIEETQSVLSLNPKLDYAKSEEIADIICNALNGNFQVRTVDQITGVTLSYEQIITEVKIMAQLVKDNKPFWTGSRRIINKANQRINYLLELLSDFKAL